MYINWLWYNCFCRIISMNESISLLSIPIWHQHFFTRMHTSNRQTWITWEWDQNKCSFLFWPMMVFSLSSQCSIPRSQPVVSYNIYSCKHTAKVYVIRKGWDKELLVIFPRTLSFFAYLVLILVLVFLFIFCCFTFYLCV